MAEVDGYWGSGYWGGGYWGGGYWGKYGTAAGGDSARYYYMKRPPYKKDKRSLLIQVKNLLLALKGD